MIIVRKMTARTISHRPILSGPIMSIIKNSINPSKNGRTESDVTGVHRKRMTIPEYVSQIRMMPIRLAAICSQPKKAIQEYS